MARGPWWPTVLAAQAVVAGNIKIKISNHATALSLTPADITEIQDTCGAFIAAFEYTNQSKGTMQGVTQWRERVFNGDPDVALAPAPPEFRTAPDIPFPQGVVVRIQRIRDRILLNKGYNQGIGEDLGLIGPEEAPKNPLTTRPELKTAAGNDYTVRLVGSMQSMEAMRVEWAPKGGAYRTVAFLTSTPANITITPEVPGKPESGSVRAVFVRKNQDFGQYSADYPVTVS